MNKVKLVNLEMSLSSLYYLLIMFNINNDTNIIDYII